MIYIDFIGDSIWQNIQVARSTPTFQFRKVSRSFCLFIIICYLFLYLFISLLIYHYYFHYYYYLSLLLLLLILLCFSCIFYIAYAWIELNRITLFKVSYVILKLHNSSHLLKVCLNNANRPKRIMAITIKIQTLYMTGEIFFI